MEKATLGGAYLSKERLNLSSEFLDFLANLGKISHSGQLGKAVRAMTILSRTF
jgi:hypothetical protein